MTAMDTVLDTSTIVLESLDFEIPCDHSRHNNSPFHAGPAEYVAMVTHDCKARPYALGSKYVCCATWARKVQDHADKSWVCPVCQDVQDGRDMVIILGPLDTM